MGAIPPTFRGTPSQFANAMVRRMEIVSPQGTGFIFTGDTEPTSNVGPWLRGGTKWYVWDESINRYVPLDISDSETIWFHIGAGTPSSSTPAVWLRTTLTPTEANPSAGRALGWYVFDGTNWVPFNGIVASGATADRPTSPIEFQEYYDTDISVRIWWERNAWRTVSGVPGDVKFTAHTTLSEALRVNPGWQLLGAGNAQFRGRVISGATKDATGTETVLPPPPNVAERAAFETYGEDEGIQTNGASPVPYPPTVALWTLVKL